MTRVWAGDTGNRLWGGLSGADFC